MNFAKEAYHRGYYSVLEKLGIAQAGKDMSHSMSYNPIPNTDENMPAGQLAKMLTGIREPENTGQLLDPKETAEDRLNKDVSWSEPVTMPSDSGRQGPSAIMAGAF